MEWKKRDVGGSEDWGGAWRHEERERKTWTGDNQHRYVSETERGTGGRKRPRYSVNALSPVSLTTRLYTAIIYRLVHSTGVID